MINSINTLGHHISAVAGSVMHARTKSAVRVRMLATSALLGAVFVMSTAGIAEANDLKSYSTTVSGKTNIITDIVSYVSYLGGAILSALGVVDMKKHVENPGQTPLKNGLAKLGFGGVLLALPFLSGVMADTMAGSGSDATFKKFTNKPTI